MRNLLIRIYYILFYWSKGLDYYRINRIFSFLMSSQYWDLDNLEKYQLTKINDLILKTQEKENYYTKKYAVIKLPISKLAEFNENIPPIDRIEVISNGQKLETIRHSKKTIATTSGSTGEPLTVSISPMAIMFRYAGRMRFYEWWGIKEFDKNVLIWGRKDKTKKNRLNPFSHLKSFFKTSFDINVFDLSDSTIHKYFQIIKDFKPAYIRGYKSAILQFAELLEKNDLKFETFKLKLAIVTSEVLLENERKFIEKILNCKVANEYGSAESGLFAFECPHGSMHIFEESVYIHTNNDGEVFATELYNDSMPLINYKNNDVITISDQLCSCGRNLRRITSIEGRLNDYVIKPDGTKVSQYIFYYIMKELEDRGYSNSIKKYKVIQRHNNFIFYIQPGKMYNNNVEQYISKRLIMILGDEIKTIFHLVDDIPREKSGKLRFFIREVN